VELSKTELNLEADPDILWVYIRHLAIKPASALEVDHSQRFRRVRVEINIIIRIGIDPTLMAQFEIVHLVLRATFVADPATGEMNHAAAPAFHPDQLEVLFFFPPEKGQRAEGIV
jgi:hypothetical protein